MSRSRSSDHSDRSRKRSRRVDSSRSPVRNANRRKRQRSASTSPSRRARSRSPDRRRRDGGRGDRQRAEREDGRRDSEDARYASRYNDKQQLPSRKVQAVEEGGGGVAREEPPVEAEPPAPAPVAAVVRKPVRAGPAGGVYIPPFKLAQMLRECNDKEGAEFQRMSWDALRKSINGLINKVNTLNIRALVGELFAENLVRGQGLFCRSIMKSQMASPSFTAVYAALVAIINTKLPEVGELLLHRVVLQFRRAFKRNDKAICTAAVKFLAHLVNQQVVHELLGLEVMMTLLETPTEDSVELAVNFVKEVGATLEDLAPPAMISVLDRLRTIAQEGLVNKRTQYVIEGLLALRKKGWVAAGFKPIPDGLDLVETEDQITHEMGLDDKLDPRMYLDVFKFDPDLKQKQEEYDAFKREIVGDEEDEGGGDGEEGGEDEEPDTEDEEEAEEQMKIQDQSQVNLVNLRRTIYLTIMSSMDFEEAGHKLLKINLAPGQEVEVATMLIECCCQEKTFLKYYGLLAQRFCYVNRAYQECFEDMFVKQYQLIHRLETNKLRNVAKLFAHLLYSDAISWQVLDTVRLTEEDTTSSSRIFIKVLFQELSEYMGLLKLNERLQDPGCAPWFGGLFPQDTARNMRFSINYFTSIGLGGLTDAMREHLKNLPKLMMQQQAEAAAAAAAAGSGESSDDSSSSSDSESESGSDSSSESDSSSSGSGSDSSGSDSDGSDSSESNSDSTSSESEEKEDVRKQRRAARSTPNGGSGKGPARQEQRGEARELKKGGRSPSRDRKRDRR